MGCSSSWSLWPSWPWLLSVLTLPPPRSERVGAVGRDAREGPHHVVGGGLLAALPEDEGGGVGRVVVDGVQRGDEQVGRLALELGVQGLLTLGGLGGGVGVDQDRKSTRLNSSHVAS